MAQAECRRHPAQLWDIPENCTTNPAPYVIGYWLCGTCPVARECARDALAAAPIWPGTVRAGIPLRKGKKDGVRKLELSALENVAFGAPVRAIVRSIAPSYARKAIEAGLPTRAERKGAVGGRGRPRGARGATPPGPGARGPVGAPGGRGARGAGHA